MRQFCFIVLFLLSIVSQAQQYASDLWHEGKMVLENGDTLRGTIKYDLQTDLIQIQYRGKVEAHSARKILFFEIFDTTVKRYRQFYSLPYNASSGYKAPIFFELLAEGKITLLCREALEYRNYYNSFYYYGSYRHLVLVYKYFLLDDKGNIYECVNKKSDWMEQMKVHAEDIQKYSKTNRLDFDDKYDLKRIIEYYNSFFVR